MAKQVQSSDKKYNIELGKGTTMAYVVLSTIEILLVVFGMAILAFVSSKLWLIPYSMFLAVIIGIFFTISFQMASSVVKQLEELSGQNKNDINAEKILQDTKLMSRTFWIFTFSGLVMGSILVSKIRKLVFQIWDEKTGSKITYKTAMSGLLGWIFVRNMISGVLLLPITIIQPADELTADYTSTQKATTQTITQTNAERIVEESGIKDSLPAQTDDGVTLEDVYAYDNTIFYQSYADFGGEYIPSSTIQEVMIDEYCTAEYYELLESVDEIVWDYTDTTNHKTYSASLSAKDCGL